MKYSFLAVIAATSLFTSCTNAPKADKAETAAAREAAAPAGAVYRINDTESSIEWVGSKPTGSHHGKVKIKEGSLSAIGSNITSGRFVMDITTLQPDDKDAATNEKLRKHLHSGDFFDVEKYPVAVFEITGVQAGIDTSDKDLIMKDATHMVTGNLSMKETEKNISFPARIRISDAQIVADANFNIDRTQWGINYKSDKSLGDKIIYPEVNIKIHLVANK